MAQWYAAARISRQVIGFTIVLITFSGMLRGAEIPPEIGPWQYKANQCTNFSNASTWAEDCRKLDGGTWTGSNTASDPFRCEDMAHPRPWPLESMIEPLASARAGGTAVLEGWLGESESVNCTGFFDTRSLTKKLGVESGNVSLVSINGNAGAWGARRDRDVDCPPGSHTLLDRCLQLPAADPYRAFDSCPKNGTNPVNVFTGAKIHVETDFQGQGPNPIILKRYYSTRTGWREAPWEKSGFGVSWRHNYTRAVSHFQSDTFEAAVVYRGNGNRHYFKPAEVNGETIWTATEADITDELKRTEIDGQIHWEYFTHEGNREFYELASGRLVKIERRSGFALSFDYDEFGRLSAIDNGFGRALRFFYGESGLENDLITSVALYVNAEAVPDSVIRYTYEDTDPHGVQVMLDKVVYPDETPNDVSDNPFKDYLYNEEEHVYYDEEWKVDVTAGPSLRSLNVPKHLTGIIDENGDRYATYKYQRVLFSGGYRYLLPVWGGNGAADNNGQYANEYKITRYHSGSHRQDSRSHEGYAVIEDALGASREFHFKYYSGVLRPTQILGGRCEICGTDTQRTLYDERGIVNERIDFAGNKTLLEHGQKGLELCRLEGISTIDAAKNAPRRIVTDWDYEHRVVLARRTYVPTPAVNLTACESANNSGWILRHEVINTYVPNSARLTTRTELSYNDAGILDELPRTTTYSYYGMNEQHGLAFQLKEIDGPRTDVEDIMRYRYATLHSSEHNPGDLIAIENALGHETRMIRHDKFGRALEVTDANGIHTLTAYHPRGWVKSRNIAGKQTNFEYDKVGQLKKITLANGGYLNYDYDTAHRLIDVTDNFGNTIHYELDPLGNRVAELTTDPDGALRRQLASRFNELNQREKVITYTNEHEQQIRGFVFNSDGTLSKEIDPRDPGISVESALPTAPTIFAEHTYDALKRVISSRDKQGGITRYTYDIFDRLLTTTEPDGGDTSTPQGLTTHYQRNSFGDLLQMISPDTGVTRYTYDQAGNRITWQNAVHHEAGVLVNYYYDALNRIERVDYPGADTDISYEYDDMSEPHGIGRLSFIRDASGETRFSYDAWGNTHSVETLRNSVLKQTSYFYNDVNQLEALVTPGGKRIQSVFRESGADEGSNLLARIELHESNHQQLIVDDITYAPFGPIISWSYNNGVQAQTSRDLSYRIAAISYGHFVDREYIRDAALNPTQIINKITGDEQQIGYDYLDRLSEFSNGSDQYQFEYDALGNRQSASFNESSTVYFYTPGTHHLNASVGADGTTFSYNASGSMQAAYGSNFSYGMDARLKGAHNGVVASEYQHNALGQRTEKTADHKTVYYYDLLGRLIEETDRYGVTAKTYVYMEDLPVAQIEEDINPFADTDSDGMLNGFEIHYGFNVEDAGDATTDLDQDGYSNLSEHQANTDPTDASSFPGLIGYQVKQIPALNKIAGLIAAAALMAIVLPHINSASLVVCLVLMFSWLIAETASAKVHYIHTDHLGTPIAMTDQNGAVTWSAQYKPYGAAIVHPDSLAELNLRFPGQYFDKETGLHYNFHRDYDPRTGRYIESDPIGLDGGLNTYAYALANPLRYIDKFGLAVWVCNRATERVSPSFGRGNHAYLWDDRDGASCGQQGSYGFGKFGEKEAGWPVDACNIVEGSAGKEDDIMSCCTSTANDKQWIPFFNDCHNAVDDCIVENGLTNPGAPGGRVWPRCDSFGCR